MSDTTPDRQPAAAGGKMTRKQEQAIAALLTSATEADAAQVCGVSERTLRNWKNDPTFAAAYKIARDGLLAHAVGNLHSAAGAAVKTLQEIAEDASQPPAPRVSAAGKIIEMSIRAREVIEFDERLTAVEKLQEKAGAR